MHSRNMMTPDQIKKLRDDRSWSQQELAAELGVDQATVSRIERGTEPSKPVKRLLEMLMANTASSGEAA